MSILARLVVLAVALTAAVHGQSVPATVFMDLTPGLGTVYHQYVIGGSSFVFAPDTVTTRHGYASIRAYGAGSATLNAYDVLADSGRRITFGFNPESVTALTFFGVRNTYGLSMTAGGFYALTIYGVPDVTFVGSTPVVPNAWTQISVSSRIDSAASYTIHVFINDAPLPDITASGGLITTGATDLQFIQWSLARTTYRFQDFYIDAGADLSNPAATGPIYVTAKRPIGNGALNQYTTHGTPTGIGSGHAAWVSERPWSDVNYLDQTSSTTKHEDFAIEGIADGDDDLTGATILAHQVWQMARVSGNGSKPTMSQFDNGSAFVFQAPTAFGWLTTQLADGAVYPSTAPIVGQRSSKGTGKVPALAAAGVVVAYRP